MPLRSPKSLLWTGRAVALASIVPSHILAGVVLGWLADQWLHLPVLRALGAVLGTVSGFVQLIREWLRSEKKDQS